VSVYEISLNIYFVQLIISLMLSLIWTKRDYSYGYISLVLISALVNELLSHSDYRTSNIFQISNKSYTIIEVVCICLFYFVQVGWKNWISYTCVVLIGVIEIVVTYFLEGQKYIDTISVAFSALIIDFCCIVYLRRLYSTFPFSGNPLHSPLFWITTGNLFFYSFSWIYLNTISFLPLEVRQQYSPVNAIFNNVLYLVYTIGFLCRIRIKPFSFF
jgi:hypothetical protein